MASVLFNIARICNSRFKYSYLKNQKMFLNFLCHFWNLHHILNILKEEMMIIANVFPKLRTLKNFVTPLCKKCCFYMVRQSTCEGVHNTCEMSMRVLLSCFFINLTDVDLENTSASVKWNLRGVF